MSSKTSAVDGEMLRRTIEQMNEIRDNFRSEVAAQKAENEEIKKRHDNIASKLFKEHEELNKAKTRLHKGRSVAKISAESVGTGAGIGLIAIGTGVCFIPLVGPFIGGPMIVAGIAGAVTGGVFLGIDTDKEISANKVVKLAKERQNLNLTYGQAVEFLENKPHSVNVMTANGNFVTLTDRDLGER